MTKNKLNGKKLNVFGGVEVGSGLGGAIGSVAHDLWMNPCDVVKQRLQLKGSPYKNMSYGTIIRSIYRTEGVKAFYLSFPTQIAINGMWITIDIIFFTLTSQMKQFISSLHRLLDEYF